jgi:hypothetical protein
MRFLTRFLMTITVFSATACDYTDFESTWRDPSAPPLQMRTEHVAAILLSANESVRRSFEQNLAGQLNEHGIEATPGYRLVSDADVTNREEILSELQETRVEHAVFMRIVDRELEVSWTPSSVWYPGPYYDPFHWYGGAYIGPGGWGGPWPPYYDAGYYRVDTVVSVETLIYSVPEAKLVWSGLSKTMNPDEVDDFVEDLVDNAVKEMKKTGFFPA